MSRLSWIAHHTLTGSTNTPPTVLGKQQPPRPVSLALGITWRLLGILLTLVLTLELLGAGADQAPPLGGVRQFNPERNPQPDRVRTVLGEKEAPAQAGASSARFSDGARTVTR
jgi:hypothetical protein